LPIALINRDLRELAYKMYYGENTFCIPRLREHYISLFPSLSVGSWIRKLELFVLVRHTLKTENGMMFDTGDITVLLPGYGGSTKWQKQFPNLRGLKMVVMLEYGLNLNMKNALQKLAEKSRMLLRPLSVEVSVKGNCNVCERSDMRAACNRGCIKSCEDLFRKMVILREGD
jgi:hypothetical protein